MHAKCADEDNHVEHHASPGLDLRGDSNRVFAPIAVQASRLAFAVVASCLIVLEHDLLNHALRDIEFATERMRIDPIVIVAEIALWAFQFP